jgi:hypothetical protein
MAIATVNLLSALTNQDRLCMHWLLTELQVPCYSGADERPAGMLLIRQSDQPRQRILSLFC